MPIGRKTVSVAIPADADYVDIIRLVLYGITTKMGFPYEDIDDMKIAVSEACNNAALHAYKETQLGYINIDFIILDNRVEIKVKDSGVSFDIKKEIKKSKAHHDKQLNELEISGLGIFLMNSLMDEVKVNNDSGTEVVLTKWLN